MSHLQSYFSNPNVFHDFLILGFNGSPHHELVTRYQIQSFDLMGTVNELFEVTRNTIIVIVNLTKVSIFIENHVLINKT